METKVPPVTCSPLMMEPSGGVTRFWAKDVAAGGKRRRASFITARVYGRLDTDEMLISDSFLKVVRISCFSFLNIGGWVER